jgi:hypothetical protein
MINSKNMYHYAFALGLVMIASFFGNKFKQSFETNDDYDLIKKYLLNESPLYGFNKPKIWVHSKNEINARKWKSFYSRNTTDLNQPYKHLTIMSIINHCGSDFNVCLIDDETFSKLIPTWDIQLSTIAEPMRSHLREIGMLQLVYFYGGMAVPNSFLCLKNLIGLYNDGISSGKPFACETINRSTDLMKQPNKLLFSPDIKMFGAAKNDPTIRELIDYLKQKNQTPHFSSDREFLGDVSQWCIKAIQANKMNLIGGEFIGVKTNKRKTILVEDLMEENFLDLNDNAYGIYIPDEDILNRPKYQWFAVMSIEEILKTNAVISKHIKASIVDDYSIGKITESSEKRTVMSI